MENDHKTTGDKFLNFAYKHPYLCSPYWIGMPLYLYAKDVFKYWKRKIVK